MTTGEKLASLRKQNNYTQEQLASLLDVSRQSISKWESNLAYPETEKLVRISKLYGCSLDYLLNDELEHDPMEPVLSEEKPSLFKVQAYSSMPDFEWKSKRMVGSLPLCHISFKKGVKARGVFAAGFNATGVFAFGLIARGLISFGVLSMGGISLGVLSIALLALGSFAFGLIAAGAIAAGIFAAGAVAFGLFSMGALANGYYAALGDYARAAVACGDTTTIGRLVSCEGSLTPQAVETLNHIVPWWLGWAKRLFCLLAGC